MQERRGSGDGDDPYDFDSADNTEDDGACCIMLCCVLYVVKTQKLYNWAIGGVLSRCVCQLCIMSHSLLKDDLQNQCN